MIEALQAIAAYAPFIAGWLLIGFLLAYIVLKWHMRQIKRHRELAARADQQHTWVLEDDPRGTYGNDYQSLDDQVWKVGFRG